MRIDKIIIFMNKKLIRRWDTRTWQTNGQTKRQMYSILWPTTYSCKSGDLQSIFAHCTSAVIPSEKTVIISLIRSRLRAFRWRTPCVGRKPAKGARERKLTERLLVRSLRCPVWAIIRQSRGKSLETLCYTGQWISNQRTLDWICIAQVPCLCIMQSSSITSANIAISDILLTRNSSGDEIANVNFLQRHRTRTTAHNKVHFA